MPEPTAQTITVACPNCHFTGRVPPSALGRSIRCRKCGTSFVVPHPLPPSMPPLPPARSLPPAIVKEKPFEDDPLRLFDNDLPKELLPELPLLPEPAEVATSVPAPLSVSELKQGAESYDRSPPSAGRRFVFSIIVGLILLVAITTFLWMRNNGLRNNLKTCDSYGVVDVDVYYDGMFSTDVVVFDLKDGGSPNARRIDPVHLLLQFAAKLDLTSVRRVVLARSKRHVFYIDASDLQRLADSYDGGGRVWAFNHLPESARTMSGSRAYGEWTGGLLGVLQKQMEDLDDLIRTWTGH